MLEKIYSPQDIKKLTTAELKILSQEIRQAIIESVSRQGGHLASSLGAVEICLALHYCLNTPQDTLIFDVGHQSYAHKMITGRKDKFSQLRARDGISGFPNFEESAYDTYISGHASTAVSWAQGIAEAKRLQGKKSKTVAVIGDGSLTGGMCFEALNNCGHRQTDILIVLNHNEMSISSSVGALSNYLTKIISLPIYNRIRNELNEFLSRLPQFTKKLIHTGKRFEEAIKSLVVPGVFFEELGFRYFGPLDGHDMSVLIPSISNILSLDGPRILHVVTKKGKGYRFAEDDAEDFHSASSFSVETGDRVASGEKTFSSVFARQLTSLAEKDNRIVAVTAAMAAGTGLNVFKASHPKRFFDVGIAEAHAVGMASGLAKQGLRPFVAIYSTFLQRSFDQIIHDVALQGIPVVFCVDRAGFSGEDGPTHHGVFDIPYLRMVPEMVCMAPKDAEELQDMVAFALTLSGPSSIRYPKGKAYSLQHREAVNLGKAQVLVEGKDVCIIALGSMVKAALGAAEILKEKGIDTCVVNARFIKPLDEELLGTIGKTFRYIVTMEEGVVNGGFASGVLEFYHKADCTRLPAIRALGVPDEFSTFASRQELLNLYGLDKESCAKMIMEMTGVKIDVAK